GADTVQLALAAGEARLERARVLGQRGDFRLGLAAARLFLVQPLTEPGADGRTDRSSDRAAGRGADRNTAAEADRPFLGHAPVADRERGYRHGVAHEQHDQSFLVHDSAPQGVY